MRLLVSVAFCLLTLLVQSASMSSASSDDADALGAFIGGGGETYLLYPDGSTSLLTALPTPAGSSTLAISPSGQEVAVTRPTASGSEIVLVSIADGQADAVPDTLGCGSPAFHPNGIHLLAICHGEDAVGRSMQAIALFHRDRGYIAIVTTNIGGGWDSTNPGFLGRVLVSPDGATALVESYLGDGATFLRRIWLTDGSVEPFVVNGYDACGAQSCSDIVRVRAFMADGRILASACHSCTGAGPSSESPDFAPLLIDPDGNVSEVLADLGEEGSVEALSPDGRILLFTRYGSPDFVSTLWRLDRASGQTRFLGTGRHAAYPQASSPAVASTEPTAFWTAVVASKDNYAEAEVIATRLHALGLPGAVLKSDDYSSLNPGYWVVYSGQFADHAGAATWSSHLQSLGFSGTYPRWVER